MAVATELTIRQATEADADRVLELVRLSLGEGTIPRERDYWDWKHQANPFGPSAALLAEADGEVVGLRMFMRWRWVVAGRQVPAVRAVDTATHPDFRGRGIFRSLTLELAKRLEEDGVAFVFNTPNDQSRPGYLKMGWSSVGRVSLRIRPLRPLRMAGALLSRRRGANGLRESLPGEQATPGFSSADTVLSGIDLGAFLARVERGESQISTDLSPEYLRWRYADVPGFSYQAAWDGEGEDGALVLFRLKRHRALTELRFSEVLVGPTAAARRACARLLAKVSKSVRADYAAAMALHRSAGAAALGRAGFLPAPRIGPILTVRPLAGVAGADPLDRARWQLSIGDLELF